MSEQEHDPGENAEGAEAGEASESPAAKKPRKPRKPKAPAPPPKVYTESEGGVLTPVADTPEFAEAIDAVKWLKENGDQDKVYAVVRKVGKFKMERIIKTVSAVRAIED